MIPFIAQWILKVGNEEYLKYDFGDSVKLTKNIKEATVMNDSNKLYISSLLEYYEEHEPKYEKVKWIKVRVLPYFGQ